MDTKLLVYAHRRDSEFHDAPARSIRTRAQGRGAWAIPCPCLHEFFAIVIHPRIYDPPTRHDVAVAQVEAWLGAPTLALLGESSRHWPERGALTRPLACRSRPCTTRAWWRCACNTEWRSCGARIETSGDFRGSRWPTPSSPDDPVNRLP